MLGEEDARLFQPPVRRDPSWHFEGQSILHLDRTLETVAAATGVPVRKLEELARKGREKLYEARSKPRVARARRQDTRELERANAASFCRGR